jgi:hypothetical protein
MKLLKPNWVHHDGKKNHLKKLYLVVGTKNKITIDIDNPIFSIDVHPDSSRFATGGQGSIRHLLLLFSLIVLIICPRF